MSTQLPCTGLELGGHSQLGPAGPCAATEGCPGPETPAFCSNQDGGAQKEGEGFEETRLPGEPRHMPPVGLPPVPLFALKAMREPSGRWEGATMSGFPAASAVNPSAQGQEKAWVRGMS